MIRKAAVRALVHDRGDRLSADALQALEEAVRLRKREEARWSEFM